MAGIGFTPSGTVRAEDIRNLQNWTGHERRVLCGRSIRLRSERETIQRAHDLLDGFAGDARVERRRVKFGVPEQPRGIEIISLCH